MKVQVTGVVLWVTSRFVVVVTVICVWVYSESHSACVGVFFKSKAHTKAVSYASIYFRLAWSTALPGEQVWSGVTGWTVQRTWAETNFAVQYDAKGTAELSEVAEVLVCSGALKILFAALPSVVLLAVHCTPIHQLCACIEFTHVSIGNDAPGHLFKTCLL